MYEIHLSHINDNDGNGELCSFDFLDQPNPDLTSYQDSETIQHIRPSLINDNGPGRLSLSDLPIQHKPALTSYQESDIFQHIRPSLINDNGYLTSKISFSDLLNQPTSDTIIQVDNEYPPSRFHISLLKSYCSRTPQQIKEERYASEVRSLVKDYSDGSLSTAGFFNKLYYLLKLAGSSLSLLQIANDLYEANCSTSTRYVNIIKKFKEFLGLDGPFSGDFFDLFQQVYMKHLTMLNKLQTHKGKVNNKLKSIKKWKRFSNVFFFGAFSIVLIGSVVAAAVAAPPLVTASATVATVPLGSLWKWVNTLWNKYEHKSSVQMEMISAMQVGIYIVIKDLDNIKALVDKLEANMESMRKIVGFAIREEEHESMGIAVDEVKNMMNVLAKTIHDLSDHSDKCIRDVEIARTMILQTIIKHPSDSL